MTLEPQDDTDLDKCFRQLPEEDVLPLTAPIYILGAFGGRFDHVMYHLGLLHRFPDRDIRLVGDGNVTRLLRPGRHQLQIDAHRTEMDGIGLVPVTGPAVVSTQGLRYNMDRMKLSFGVEGRLSTSNSVHKEVVQYLNERHRPAEVHRVHGVVYDTDDEVIPEAETYPVEIITDAPLLYTVRSDLALDMKLK